MSCRAFVACRNVAGRRRFHERARTSPQSLLTADSKGPARRAHRVTFAHSVCSFAILAVRGTRPTAPSPCFRRSFVPIVSHAPLDLGRRKLLRCEPDATRQHSHGTSHESRRPQVQSPFRANGLSCSRMKNDSVFGELRARRNDPRSVGYTEFTIAKCIRVSPAQLDETWLRPFSRIQNENLGEYPYASSGYISDNCTSRKITFDFERIIRRADAPRKLSRRSLASEIRERDGRNS
jgi:hypothetical protein